MKMLRMRLRFAVLVLVLMAGVQDVRACDPCYVYPPVSATIVKKICYTELVPEKKDHTRIAYRIEYKEEPCEDCSSGCGAVHCFRKVPVCVPVMEKYTTCTIVPKIVEKEINLTVPCCDLNCCK